MTTPTVASGRMMRNAPILRCGPRAGSRVEIRAMPLLIIAWVRGDIGCSFLVAMPPLSPGALAGRVGVRAGPWYQRFLVPGVVPRADAVIPARSVTSGEK